MTEGYRAGWRSDRIQSWSRQVCGQIDIGQKSQSWDRFRSHFQEEALTLGTSTATSLMALGLTSFMACRKSCRVTVTDAASLLSGTFGRFPRARSKAHRPAVTRAIAHSWPQCWHYQTLRAWEGCRWSQLRSKTWEDAACHKSLSMGLARLGAFQTGDIICLHI